MDISKLVADLIEKKYKEHGIAPEFIDQEDLIELTRDGEHVFKELIRFMKNLELNHLRIDPWDLGCDTDNIAWVGSKGLTMYKEKGIPYSDWFKREITLATTDSN